MFLCGFRATKHWFEGEKQFDWQQVLQYLHCAVRTFGHQTPGGCPAESRAAAAVSSLCAEPRGLRCEGGKVSQTHSSSEYLSDGVMAAGGRVTQHEEWQPDSTNTGWERQNHSSTTLPAVLVTFENNKVLCLEIKP